MKKTRMITNDVAYNFRMGAGFAGDVNRTHPASIEAALIGNAPPTAYGQAVLVEAASQGVRPFTVGDAAGAAYGVTVRAFPTQQTQTSQNFGAAGFGSVAPPTNGVIDVLRAGYIMVNLPFGGAPVKGGGVYVRVAATAGSHIQGAFEAAADGANNVLLSNAIFNGSPDANGNVEIQFNV